MGRKDQRVDVTEKKAQQCPTWLTKLNKLVGKPSGSWWGVAEAREPRPLGHPFLPRFPHARHLFFWPQHVECGILLSTPARVGGYLRPCIGSAES